MVAKAKSGRRSTATSGSRSTAKSGGRSAARTGGKSKSASTDRSKTRSGAKSRSVSTGRSKTQSGAKRKAASSTLGKTQSRPKRKAASSSRGKTQSSANRRSPSHSKTHAPSERQVSPGRGRTDRGNQGQTTRDHEFIRRWAEERGGKPSVVEGTQILRFNFDEPGGDDDDRLKEISWEEFFQVFDDSDLSLIFSERSSKGQTSRFFKFVREE
jgi:hypothetical protein